MLAREYLVDPARREELETQYLTLLMKKDAAVWAQHATAALMQHTVPDEDEAGQSKDPRRQNAGRKDLVANTSDARFGAAVRKSPSASEVRKHDQSGQNN